MAEETGHPRRCVVLGVTGSIAAYKAAELTSQLVQGGVDVHVLMTDAAAKFVAPGTFAALCWHPVATGRWQNAEAAGLDALAEKADVYVIAPATANILGKLARGMGDGAVSAFALLHDGPTLVAPAMNPRMWANAATQANCERLRERGVLFVGPDEGRCSCGEEGTGRLAPVEQILEAIRAQLVARELPTGGQPLKLLVTAGPTREALDPVRFLSNRSSGKMGTAIAAVAAAAGHDVVLVSGPTALPTPPLVRPISVTTAAEMADAVKSEFPRCDALIMCAAVADYRPCLAADQKIKKGNGALTIELERTEDILASIAETKRPGQRVMGFAAETKNLAAAAKEKLARKRLDWIVANDVSRPDIAFGSDMNEVTVFSPDGELKLPRMSKTDLAARLLRIVAAAF